MRNPTVHLAAVVLLVLSGCAASPEDTKSVTSTKEVEVVVDAAPVEVNADDGGIDGSVVDEEQQPVSGARVQIVGGDATTTDLAGRFTFSHLEPGEYRLTVKRAGFATAGRAVPVAAAEISLLRITLKQIAFDVPYHVTHPWTGIVLVGYFNVAVGDGATPGSPSCSACLVPCNSCVTNFNTTRGLMSLVFELSANPWFASPLQANDYFWQALGRSREYGRYAADYWADGDQRSVNGGWPAGGDDFRFTHQCGLYFPCVNQRFTVYFTDFYFQGPPANFTALPPG